MEANPATTPETNVEAPAFYAPSVPAPTLAEVRYGSHLRQVLDFWRADSVAPTPFVFAIHGGAWIEGEKERVSRFVEVADFAQGRDFRCGDQLPLHPTRRAGRLNAAGESASPGCGACIAVRSKPR